jgi:Tfp pilus assembly protein FimT
VTLAVVAILCAITAPTLVGYRHAVALRAGAQELAAAVNHTRQLAISLNAPVCVAVAVGSLRLEGVSGNACTGVPLSVSGPATIELVNGLLIENTGPKVILTSLGAAIPGGSYTVVHPVTGMSLRVVVSASGRVTVQ